MKYAKDAILTTGQVSQICQVVPKTVSKWVDSGRLPGYRIPGSRDRRIVVADLLRFMRANGIPTAGLEGNNHKILLLGRECDSFQTIRHMLTGQGGCTIRHQQSVFNAGLTAEEFCPHVIYIDLNDDTLIPKQICRAIHEHRQFQYTQIIALCGHLTEGEVRALIQNGFDGVLRKPFDAEQLQASVRRHGMPQN